MGTPSANIKIGRWRSHRVLAKEITLESVEMLSRIDPEGRTAEEIQFWLRTGISISVGSYPEIKLFQPVNFPGMGYRGQYRNPVASEAIRRYGVEDINEYYNQTIRPSKLDRGASNGHH